jgi:peptide/nickel transport system ATP-binding protein
MAVPRLSQPAVRHYDEAMAPLLEVRGLRVELPTTAGWVRPVDDVSFVLAAGRTLGLVGESGSGKTMLALGLMGLLPPGARRSGEAWLAPRAPAPANNHRINLLELSASEQRRIRGRELAMVFQEPMTALNPVLRVGQQVAEAIEAHEPGLGPGERRRRVLEALERAAITQPARRARQYPHQLSGGLRQRVLIAMALAASPRLLIADEPTTALDVTVQKQILDLLARLQRELDLALLFITHDLGVVSEVADRLLVMYAGRIVEAGPTAEVLSAPHHPYTEALVRAAPRLVRAPFEPVPGTVPSLDALLPGCPFEPRCFYRQPECARALPELREIAPHRFARCILDAIPARGQEAGLEPGGQRERVRERFTRSASAYAEFVWARRTAEVERLIGLAAPQPHEVALDLACGPGTFTFALARRVKFLYGLDLTPALLAKALGALKGEGLSNVAFACGDAAALPFGDAAIDLAVCGYGLHHMSDPAAALGELARIVKRGGRLALVDLVVPETADAGRANAIERARDRSHVRTLVAQELSALAVGAGFLLRKSEREERPRDFDDWMRVAAVAPADPAWAETRRLMEATVADDAAGFRPRPVPAASGAPGLEFVQTSFFLLAEKG